MTTRGSSPADSWAQSTYYFKGLLHSYVGCDLGPGPSSVTQILPAPQPGGSQSFQWLFCHLCAGFTQIGVTSSDSHLHSLSGLGGCLHLNIWEAAWSRTTSSPLQPQGLCTAVSSAWIAWLVPWLPSDLCCNVSFSGSSSLSVTTQTLNPLTLCYFPSLHLLLDLELYNYWFIFNISLRLSVTKNNAGYIAGAQYILMMNEKMAYIFLPRHPVTHVVLSPFDRFSNSQVLKTSGIL